MLRKRGEDPFELDGAECQVDQGDAEREAEVADAVDDERLYGGVVGVFSIEPVADSR